MHPPCIDPSSPSVPESASGLSRLGRAAGRFLTGAGLPVFLTMTVLLYAAFLVAVVLAPTGSGAWAAFSEEFKIWCFGYDPRTGGMEWMAFLIMLAEPLFITALVLLVWRRGRPRPGGLLRHWRAALAGLACGMAVVGGLYAYGRPAPEEESLPPFPGERIRTRLETPAFALADHRGAPASSADLRGRVTLVTAVYVLCSTSCPEILMQTRELVDSLPPEARERLDVLALSLNPEYDTAELMGRVAEGYGFGYPEFRYLNGEPAVMRDLLKDLQFAARLNPETGMIDHANLYLLIDAGGRIAYRFNLDRRHRGWLRDAVLALTAEAAASGS